MGSHDDPDALLAWLLAASERDAGPRARRAMADAARSDRAVPPARAWLRRWRPRAAPLLPPACSCAVGRCGVCN
jgi:hypothetical protein